MTCVGGSIPNKPSMKLLFFLTAVGFVLTLVSCSEEEEPISPLIGTWENRVYVDSLEYWFVESYMFKNDSVFDLTETVRQAETGPELGYRLISTSWYNLEMGIFKYYYSDALFFFGGGSEVPRKYFVPKEELNLGIVDFFGIPEGKLTFSADGRKFNFQENCIQLNPDQECLQLPSKEFVKVD